MEVAKNPLVEVAKGRGLEWSTLPGQYYVAIIIIVNVIIIIIMVIIIIVEAHCQVNTTSCSNSSSASSSSLYISVNWRKLYTWMDNQGYRHRLQAELFIKNKYPCWKLSFHWEEQPNSNVTFPLLSLLFWSSFAKRRPSPTNSALMDFLWWAQNQYTVPVDKTQIIIVPSLQQNQYTVPLPVPN